MAASQETLFEAFSIRTAGTHVMAVGGSVTRSGSLMVILKAVTSSLMTRVLLSRIMVALRALRNRYEKSVLVAKSPIPIDTSTFCPLTWNGVL